MTVAKRPHQIPPPLRPLHTRQKAKRLHSLREERGGLWYVIVTRADGSEYIIRETKTQTVAERLAAQFGAHLEGVQGVRVEKVRGPN